MIKKENNPTIYFKENENGNYVGYHVDGDENTIDKIPLSLESLNNDNKLYLCNNSEEWWPSHLEKNTSKQFILLEVEFKKTKYKMYYKWDEYMEASADKEIVEKTGIYLHIMNKNDLSELTESFLVNPKDFVISIREINNS